MALFSVDIWLRLNQSDLENLKKIDGADDGQIVGTEHSISSVVSEKTDEAVKLCVAVCSRM